MAKPKVYIETSVVSYLTARPSGDLVVAACQQITRDWWDGRRAAFDLFVSARVIAEAAQGDARAAQARLEALKGIPVLQIRKRQGIKVSSRTLGSNRHCERGEAISPLSQACHEGEVASLRSQ